VIPHDELARHAHYGDMAELSRIFAHPAVEMDDGVWRWEADPLVRHLTGGSAPFYEGGRYGYGTRTIRGSVDLNALWVDFHHGAFPVESLMKFYMGMGYSLSGFGEVFGQAEASDWGLPGATPSAGEDEYTQTPIEWVIAKGRPG